MVEKAARGVRPTDAGRVEGGTVFTRLDAFDKDRETGAGSKARHRSGGLGDAAVEGRLEAVPRGVIGPRRER